jgi:glycosyltransferase involved in cell wall biosynthesis
MLLNSGINARLLIIGDGPYRGHLEETARKLNLQSKVIFTGALNPRELPKFYNLCDVFAFPSVLFETFPYVTLEAMACGKPVIASKTGGICEQIEHMHNGILLPPGNVSSLHQSMLLLMKDQPKLAQRLGKNAREKVSRDFNLGIMTKSVESLFLDVISEKSARK